MAKFSLKDFDAKKFLFEHCEKLIFGTLALGVLYLLWGTLDLVPYEKQPTELSEKANQVKNRVNGSQWPADYDAAAANVMVDPAAETIPDDAKPMKLVPYVAEVRASQQPVQVVALSAPANPPITQPATVRRQPKLLPLADLEATSGYGAFALVDDATAAEIEQEEEAIANVRQDEQKLKRKKAEEDRKKRELARRQRGAKLYPGMNRMAAEMGPGYTQEEMAPQPAPIPGEDPYAGMAAALNGLKIEGYRWVVVTGLVEFNKQQREILDAVGFSGTTLSPEDTLQYVAYEIERAELASPTDEPTDWKLLDLQALAKDMQRWAVLPPEIVDPSAILPQVCSPLPPRIDREWPAREVVHSSMHDSVLDNDRALKRAEEETKALQKGGTNGPAATATAPAAPYNPLQQFTTPASGAYGMPQGGYEGAAPGRVLGGPTGEGPGYGVPADVSNLENRMARFFDFTIEPGKTYVYRVRLVLRNPNYGIPARKLEKETLAKDEFVKTPWSGVTAPRSVPRPSNLLAGNRTKAPSVSKEPEVAIIVNQWNKESGADVKGSFALQRGQVANFPDQKVKAQIPGQTAKEEDVDFRTDLLLVDFSGGGKMRFRSLVTEPTEMIFVNPNGQLVTKSEIADRAQYVSAEEQIKRLSGELQQTESEDPGLPGFDPFAADPLAPRPGGRGRTGD